MDVPMEAPLVAIGALALGLIACFAGYRIFRFLIAVAGFVLGAAILGGLAWTFLSDSAVVAWAAAFLGGILGAVLLSVFYFLGIFALGAAFGALLGQILGPVIHLEPIVVSIVLGILCGFVALGAQRLLITISTAYVGSWLVVTGVAYFFRGLQPTGILHRPPLEWSAPAELLTFVVWLGLGAAGVAVQYSGGAEKRKRGDD
ncbi:MAG: hypothetical protein Kow00109_14200 [Acidobacteriota bacterium]